MAAAVTVKITGITQGCEKLDFCAVDVLIHPKLINYQKSGFFRMS